ncbi:MAG: amino acid adenylation domain-containing protein [Serratia proteamaculans]
MNNPPSVVGHFCPSDYGYSLHNAFFRQAIRTPAAIALRDDAGVMTYAELREQACSIASSLRSHGLMPETAVGVYLPRDRNLPAALIGIMAAGCAYLPLDPRYPQQRIEQLITIGQVQCVITTRLLAETLPGDITAICIEDIALADLDHVLNNDPVQPNSLAYFIFTSGSTGVPKGVMIEHGNALSLLYWAHHFYSSSQLASVAFTTSITFDLSVFEIFVPLSAGGMIHILENGLSLLDWKWRDVLTLLNTVPSVLNEVAKLGHLPQQLSVINLAGEPLPASLVLVLRAQCPNAQIFNLYGPSEDTTYSTVSEVLASDDQPTIGLAMLGRHCYLLNESGNEVAHGEVGEIYVAGPGVARGYYGRPDLESVFMPDKRQPDSYRMYRTGDFGRQLADGRILCLGRRDDQVKIRGHRVEIGEVDATMRKHPAVAEVAVVVVDSPARGKFLRCALELRDSTNQADIAAWASARLPAFMIPSEWQVFDKLPRLPNGKIDRAYLRKAATVRAHLTDDQHPMGQTEETLAQCWHRLLEQPTIGRHDSFFALGGHSLLFTRLQYHIREIFSVSIELAALMSASTLVEQAKLIAQSDVIDERAGSSEELSCTPSQRRMWTLEKLLPGSPRYNIANTFQLQGELDNQRLIAALTATAAHHAMLHTVYGESDRGLQPVPLAEHRVNVLQKNLSQMPLVQALEQAKTLSSAFQRQPFELSSNVPFGVQIITVAPTLHLVDITTHHIAADGSMELLVEEISFRYNRPHAPIQSCRTYNDYAQYLLTPSLQMEQEKSLQWWQMALANPPELLRLPFDKPAKRSTTGVGQLLSITVDQETVRSLLKLCQQHQVSLFHGLLAVTWAFLGKLSESDDVLLALPVHTRPSEYARTVGNFVNTAIARGRPHASMTFEQLLQAAKENTLQLLRHADVPFESVLNAVKGLRSAEGVPSVNVMLSLLVSPALLELEGCQTTFLPVDLGTSRFDLGLFFRYDNTGLVLNLEYDKQRFSDAMARRLSQTWAGFSANLTANSRAPLSQVGLLSEASHQKIVEDWNNTKTAVAFEGRIDMLFSQRVVGQPDHTALIAGQDVLSYQQLDRSANQLAWSLRDAGVPVGAHVGILCERGAAMVIAVLAVLKAGCVYVPIDPSTPAERCRLMATVANFSGLISDDALRTKALSIQAEVPLTLIWADSDAHRMQCDTPPDNPATADDRAYIIFTSGTTGIPKAVAVKHRPAVNLIDWVNRTFAVSPVDKLLFVTSIAFDLSVYDMLGTLAAGATLRVASREEIRNPELLSQIVSREAITFWNSAPVILDQLIPYLDVTGNPHLRLAFLSGDWIPVSLPTRLAEKCPKAELIALGGATEAVIWSNFFPTSDNQRELSSIPYGKPIQNARYYILDPHQLPVPVGVEGDLYIGGDVLAEGYYGDAHRTAEKFCRDPFVAAPSARMYFTGDRARFFDDGNIEFLGRQDSQVKINGYRIEIDEIEAAILRCEGIVATHVSRKGERHHYWLCAYIVGQAMTQPDIALIKGTLSQSLPEYMIPALFITIDEMPVTVNGKLDKSKLPEPKLNVKDTEMSSENGMCIEEKIKNVWRIVLNRNEIGLADNFFDAGGDSARLIQTHRALQDEIGFNFPVMILFQYTTISSLAQWLKGHSEKQAATQLVPTDKNLSARQRVMQLQKNRRNINR